MKLALTTFLLFSISAFQHFSMAATSTIEALTDATTISASDKVWLADVDGSPADVDATLEQIVSPFAADPSSNSAFDAAEWAADLNITSAWADVTGKPTTISGYGITDAYTVTAADAAFATAAQGATADTAVQPADNISTLTNDSGFIVSSILQPSITDSDAVIPTSGAVIEYLNGAEMAGALGRARYQRVALVGLGDSNQLLSGHGWAEAWGKEFGEEFGVFGSGIHRNFSGTGTADFVSSTSDTADSPISTIPEALSALVFDVTRGAYWLQSSVSDSQTTGSDFCIKDPLHSEAWIDLFPLSNSLKYDIHYGVIEDNYKEALTATDAVWQSASTVRFSLTEDLGITYAGQYIVTTTFSNASNNGTFLISAVGAGYVDATTARADATDDETSASALADIAESHLTDDGLIEQWGRLNESPYTTLFHRPDTDTFGADYAIADLTWVQSADAARSSWDKFVVQHRNNSVSTHGPVLIAGQQLTSPDILTGIAYTTMVYEGGEGLDTFYNILYEDSTDAALVEYWRQIRLNLNGEKSAVVFINSALNDRNETEPSPAGQVGDSKGAYAERLGLIIDKLSRTWQMPDSSGYSGSANSLQIVVIPSHPISDPDDSEMIDYRLAAQQVAQGRPGVSFVLIPELVPQSEFVSGGYYASGGSDTNHLTRTGYRAVAQAVVDFVKSFEIY